MMIMIMLMLMMMAMVPLSTSGYLHTHADADAADADQPLLCIGVEIASTALLGNCTLSFFSFAQSYICRGRHFNRPKDSGSEIHTLR